MFWKTHIQTQQEEQIKKLQVELKDAEDWKRHYRDFVFDGRTLHDWIKLRCEAEEKWHHGNIDHDVREKTKELNEKLNKTQVERAEWKGKAEALELSIKALISMKCKTDCKKGDCNV